MLKIFFAIVIDAIQKVFKFKYMYIDNTNTDDLLKNIKRQICNTSGFPKFQEISLSLSLSLSLSHIPSSDSLL